MAEKLHQIGKQTWYRWSFYINVVLFFIVAFLIYLLTRDCLDYRSTSSSWMYVTRDLVLLAIALAFIFFQFFRNLMTIMRRSL